MVCLQLPCFRDQELNRHDRETLVYTYSESIISFEYVSFMHYIEVSYLAFSDIFSKFFGRFSVVMLSYSHVFHLEFLMQ